MEQHKATVAINNFASAEGIDLTLEAMNMAEEIYKSRDFVTRDENYANGTRLAKLGVFSTGQIASITGVAPATARKYGWGKGIPSNRFDPESISILRVLYRQYKKSGTVSPKLAKLAHEQGCSYGLMARLLETHTMTVHRAAQRG